MTERSETSRRFSGDALHRQGGGSAKQHVPGQLYVALTSSSSELYNIHDPLQFNKGDYMVSKTGIDDRTGLIRGYVRERSRYGESGKFHVSQVRAVEDPSSAISPGEKRKATVGSLPPHRLPSLHSNRSLGSRSDSFRSKDDHDCGDGDEAYLDNLGRAKKQKKIMPENKTESSSRLKAGISHPKWVPPALRKQQEQEEQKKAKMAPTALTLSEENKIDSAAPMVVEEKSESLTTGTSTAAEEAGQEVGATADQRRCRRSDDKAAGADAAKAAAAAAKDISKAASAMSCTAAQGTLDQTSGGTANATTAAVSSSETLPPANDAATQYMQVPDDIAAKARFPPGCAVMCESPDPIITGLVRSVHLHLTTPQLIPGKSKFDVLYHIGTARNMTPIPEKKITFAKKCPVFVQSTLVPPSLGPSKNDDEWVSGTVLLSFKTIGDDEESYVVILENGSRVNGVPRDSIRYRQPALHTVQAAATGATSATSPVSSSLDAPAPAAAPTATASAPTAAPKLNAMKPPAVVLAPALLPSTPTTASTSEDASDMDTRDSASLPSSKGCKDEKTARRINIPDRIPFEDVKQHLVGPDSSINKRMVKSLRVTIHVVGRDMSPPRDAEVVRTFGELFPLPLVGGGHQPCVLICGNRKQVDSAVKVIAHILVEKAYNGEDKETLKQELLSVGDKKGGAVAKSTGSATAKPQLVQTDSGRTQSAKQKPPNGKKCVTMRIELPREENTHHLESLFAFDSDGMVSIVERDTNCTISMKEGGKDDIVYSIDISGSEGNSVSYASKLVRDILVESGVERSDIVQKEVVSSSEVGSSATQVDQGPIKVKNNAEAAFEEPFKIAMKSNPAIVCEDTTYTSREFTLPRWVQFAHVQAFFEGEQKKTIELQNDCTIKVLDTRPPIKVDVTGFGAEKKRGLWKVWHGIIDKIAGTLDDQVKPRFLYNVVLSNYSGSMERTKYPVLFCLSPYDAETQIHMVAIPLPIVGNYAGYVIGSRGIHQKRILSMGCQMQVYDNSETPAGRYVFITGERSDKVKSARDLVEARIHDFEIKQETGEEEDIGPVTFQQQSLSFSQMTSRIEEIVREKEPINMDQIKRVYLTKFRTKLDQTEFGYRGLYDLVNDISTIHVEALYDDGRPKPRYVLTLADEQDQASFALVSARIEEILRENKSLEIAKLKKFYREKYGDTLDQGDFGYIKLREMLEDISSVHIRTIMREDSAPLCVLSLHRTKL